VLVLAEAREILERLKVVHGRLREQDAAKLFFEGRRVPKGGVDYFIQLENLLDLCQELLDLLHV
jgi:hypothetical protein